MDEYLQEPGKTGTGSQWRYKIQNKTKESDVPALAYYLGIITADSSATAVSIYL
jgi:hypothetical protein